ncbi:MAG: aminotransferase class IV [Planctomycetes bacterium]|nr:aminotransferase class IV [Planctomycetota bacterium]
MTELAYVNGTFCDPADAKVSVEDRGFQFGDGVYEVVVSYDNRLFLLDRHLARLHRSLEAIDLPYDFEAHPIEPILLEGLRRTGFRDAMVYIQITRGACSRDHVAPDDLAPTTVITFARRPTLDDAYRQKGAGVMTVRDERWANCFVKAITLLPNVLAKNRARRKGYDDAIFVTDSGEVRECTSANLFLVHAGTILTPPRTESILHGVTQGYVMECAARIGLPVEERRFDNAFLRQADEVFMSSTSVEVLGITRVDDQPIGKGTVGPVTMQVHAEFCRSCRVTNEDTAASQRLVS